MELIIAQQWDGVKWENTSLFLAVEKIVWMASAFNKEEIQSIWLQPWVGGGIMKT